MRRARRLQGLALALGLLVMTNALAETNQFIVPRTGGQDLASAYARLHRTGLRVSFSGSFSTDNMCLPLVTSSRPSSGQHVAAGTTITLHFRPAPCGAASPGVPTGPIPSARVPNFLGQRLTAAIKWVDQHGLDWRTGRLGGLFAADAPTLLANYRVVRQDPKPGSTLKLGVGSRHGNSGTFRPTPLFLSCRRA
jgi:hypothetical protein